MADSKGRSFTVFSRNSTTKGTESSGEKSDKPEKTEKGGWFGNFRFFFVLFCFVVSLLVDLKPCYVASASYFTLIHIRRERKKV